jgi:hypothetical protein
MVRPGRDRLSGKVEVDETYVGGEEPGVSGRETQTKSIVVVAAEVLACVTDVSATSLMLFIEEPVAPG